MVLSALVPAGGWVVASPRIWEPTWICSFATSDGLTEPTDPQAPLDRPGPSLSGSWGVLVTPPGCSFRWEARHIQALETQLGLSSTPPWASNSPLWSGDSLPGWVGQLQRAFSTKWLSQLRMIQGFPWSVSKASIVDRSNVQCPGGFRWGLARVNFREETGDTGLKC